MDIPHSESICPGCGAIFPEHDGPSHPYLGTSPECWAIFNEVLAREYQNPAYMKVHRLTVDAYALQHPGTENPQTIQSAYVHLVALQAIFKYEQSFSDATQLMQAFIKQYKRKLSWLPPPHPIGSLTIKDIVTASSPEDHHEKVYEWAKSIYFSWREHHAKIEWLLRDML